MYYRIVCATIILSSIPCNSDAFVKKAMQKWFYSSFGIDINEKFTNQPFNPTIENLNTITLMPCNKPNNQTLYSVSELAYAIHHGTLSKDALFSIHDTDTSHYWHIYLGMNDIPNNETIFVYSRGYAGADTPKKEKQRGMCAIPKQGGGIVVGSQWLKGNIINGPCVVFDFPDTRNYFDFGLQNDQKCLDLIVNNLQDKTDSIVLFGNCRGAKALLTYLSRSQPKNIRAVILDAPFMGLDLFTKEIGKNYGKIIPFSKNIAKKIIASWYPNYNAHNDLTYEDLKKIPREIPIFIGHLQGDTLVSNDMIKEMVKVLRDSGHVVYLLVIDDKTKSHSRLYQTGPFQKAANSFLKKYNLPHNSTLAKEGDAMLSHAYYTAQHIDIWKSGFLHIFKA